MTMKGIDVSEHQGTIDWAKVKGAGIEFAMIRAGYGKYASQVDKCFKANADGALKAGIHIGFYWFSYATSVTEAHTEAALFYETVKPYLGRISFPLCYDFEYDSVDYCKKRGVTPDKAMVTAFAKAFLADLEAKGCYAMNYKNIDYDKNWFDREALKAYDVWLAQWGTEKPSIDGVGIWQYTSGGSVPGISGRVDMNTAYKDYPSIIQTAGLNGYKAASKPAETNPPETVGIKAGDTVKVKSGAKSYEGKVIAPFVYKNAYKVDEIKGDRAVLDKSGICTAFKVSDLIKQAGGIKTLQVGSTVRVKSGATTYDGKPLATFVYNRNHKVKEIQRDRAVITYGGVIVAAVSVKDLVLI